jgi:hypothetical protein
VKDCDAVHSTRPYQQQCKPFSRNRPGGQPTLIVHDLKTGPQGKSGLALTEQPA